MTFIDQATFTQTLANTTVLTTLEGPGAGRTYIGCHDGIDIIVITDVTADGAVIIHPCSEDREAGGSVHDHARSICC